MYSLAYPLVKRALLELNVGQRGLGLARDPGVEHLADALEEALHHRLRMALDLRRARHRENGGVRLRTDDDLRRADVVGLELAEDLQPPAGREMLHAFQPALHHDPGGVDRRRADVGAA